MDEDIGSLAAALRVGSLTSEELLDRCLERVRRIDPRLNSFVALDEEGARAAAKASDARLARGAPRSPLDGVPISVKDNIHVAGLPTTWGSRGLRDYSPGKDELPVARLRAAGAIVLGKTNVPEFTLEGYANNDLFGVTRNPWNLALTPGGSSGGAAAGVAAGLVPAAIGTDGGGSIRRPAGHNGLVGWKPSVGRFPRIDGLPAILTDFETVGTLTRTIGDVLLLDAVMAGPDARDRRSFALAAPAWSERPLRIVFTPQFGAAPVDPEVADVTERVAQGLERDGHAVRRESVFFDLKDAAHIWNVVSRAGVAWLMDVWRGGGLETLAGSSACAMAGEGRRVTGADYFDALERVAALRRLAIEFFARADLLLTPTAAALPWAAETPYPDRIDGKPAGPRDHAIFTGWANIAGVPAISLPVAVSRAGLPIGVQFAAGFGADASLLAFAGAFSRRNPPPPLPVMEQGR